MFPRLLLMSCTLLLSWSLQAQFPCFPGQISVAPGFEASFCDDSSEPNLIRFNSQPAALPRAYVVVDENDVIVFIGYANTINFSGLGDNLRVYSFTVVGSITAQLGDVLGETELASGCYALSSNFIEINSSGGQDGGMLAGGPFTFCVGDGSPDFIPDGAITLTDVDGQNTAWVITDADGNILGLPPSPYVVDFDDAGVGVCLVWHLSFIDGLEGAEVGNNAADLEGCYDLSNPITVNRAQPDGGTLEGGPFTFCVGDGEGDFIGEDEITVSGASGSNFAWVVTDTDGNILGLPPTFSAVDFDGAGAGTCLVWYLAFEDGLEGAAVGNNATDLAGCFDLSNPITVNRNQPDGGTLEGGPFTFCVGDGESDFIGEDEITVSGASGSNFAWVVTDADGNILGLPPSFTDVDFDGAGPGTCLVWYLAFEDGLEGAAVGNNAADLVGCFNLSNPITVNRNQTNGGTLAGGPFTFCVGDGESDFIEEGAITISGAMGANATWVVTDADGNILGLPGNYANVDFDGAGAGTCLVWYLAFEDGLEGAAVGNNAADLVGCFDLSNPITVNRNQPDGGTLEGGPFTFCVGDGEGDFIGEDEITVSGASGTNFAWVVTDADGNILGLPANFTDVNFDGAGPGACLVWYLAFEDGLEGAAVGNNAADLVGCFDLSNPITVNRNQPDGGTLEGGPFTFCVGDGEGDFLTEDDITVTSASGTNFAWVVTDADGNILGLPANFTDVDFDGAGAGACLVWYLAFEDGLEGAAVGNNAADLVGCFDLSNPITVNRNQPDGGTLEGGPFTFCVGDGEGDFISEDEITVSSAFGSNFAWVVTDADGNILGLPANFTDVNFDDAGTGTCLVWYLAFEDGLEGAAVGNNAADLVGCFDLSNPITVNRIDGPECDDCQVDGGTLEGGPFTFCVGNGEGDFIDEDEITLTGATGPNTAWVVTDADGNILGLPANFTDVDFDGAGAGTCLVWYLSFEDGLEGAAVGNNAADLAGCFDLSNPITVNRNQPDGGTLEGGPFTFCVGDGEGDFIGEDEITLTGATGPNTTWVVTDADGNILGLPANFTDVDFDGAGPGACLVWYLSFEDGLEGAAVGNNAADLVGCFDLSNPITVNRNQPDGGTLEGGPFTFCVGDGEGDFIGEDEITLTGATGPNTAWVVTDADGNILGLPANFTDVDFDGAGPGACLVWYLAFEDGLEGAAVGNNAADLVGCFDLSNPITVNRNQPDGGTLEGGPFSFCVGDGEGDFIGEDEITLTGATGPNTAWVVTDADGNILGLPANFTDVDFDGAGPGTCLVWYLSFEDGLEGAAVGNNAADLQGCFDLSNPITVNRNQQPEGGTLEGGPFSFCVSDGEGDFIDDGAITVTGASGSNFAWVVTDADGNILGLPGNYADVDFDGAGPGTCLVWYLAFEDGLQGAMMGNNATDLVGCFDLSNPIEVTRVAGDDCDELCLVDGGTLEGGPFEFCVSDGEGDFIGEDEITLTGATGPNTAWVVTDADGNILGLPANFTDVNFDGAGPGTCLVWYLSFEDGLEGAAVGNNAADLAGCFDLSNPITVNRNQPDGGTLEGGVYEFCVGDGQGDFIAEGSITVSGATGSNFAWVVTDADGNILGLPANYSDVNFDDAPAGTCLVWYLAFEDGLEGAMMGNNAADLVGCFDLSNPITVTRVEGPDCDEDLCNVNGGFLTGGPYTFCVGDGEGDFIPAGDITVSGATGPNTTWVVTDAEGNILGLPGDYADVNFDGAGAGTCLVWYLSFEDGLEGAAVGNNAANLQGCFDLSNPIAVNRNQPDGGTLEGGVYEFCVGDGEGDFLPEGSINLIGAQGSNFAWVITDADGNILGLPANYTDVNFDGAGPGTCLVWYLAFEDGLEGAAVGNNAADLQGCFDLSNPITVSRVEGPDCDEDLCNINGGFLMGGPFTICAGDGEEDFLNEDDITLSGATGPNTVWVITDNFGEILNLADEFTNVNFDAAGPGECLIWYLSFEDGLEGAEVGNNAADLVGCFDLSNPIAMTRNQPDGGTLEGGPFTFCVGNSAGDFIPEGAITVTDADGANFAWVVTDTDGNILGLPANYTDVNFDGAGVGTCLVWYLAFEDGLEGAAVGNNAADLTGCFDLSNPIEVNRVDGPDCDNICNVDGGLLVGGPFTFCVGDGEDDFIEEDAIVVGNVVGPNTAWVVTDLDGNILGLPENYTDVNFDGAGQGDCLIWYLAFEDGLEGAEVGNNAADLVGCFDLSNPIAVVRNQPEGGTLEGGPFSFCVSDGISDFIDAGAITLSGNVGTNGTWVITDADANILGLPGDYADVDFDGAGEGTCLVWWLSFEDGLQGAAVGNNAADLQGCFGLSNPIEVVRTPINGGTVTTADGESTVTVTVGDGNADEIEFTVSGNIGDNFTYVVTDENNIILELPEGNTVDFENAPAGICRVWGLAYTGDITAIPGDNAAGVALSSGCFNLSDAFVTVTRVDPFAPNLPQTSLNGGTVVNVQLFPNPAVNQLEVALTSRAQRNGTVTITVVDLNGQVLLQRQVPADQARTTLEVAKLPAGTYFLRTNDGTQVITKRFVKS